MMMKKTLLSILLVVCCLTVATAQSFVLPSGVTATRNPQARTLNAPARQAAPAKALGENQLYMGTYAGDDIAAPEEGIGLTAYPQTMRVAAYLPVAMLQPFAGAAVKAIRFGLCADLDRATAFLIPVTKVSGSSLTVGDPIAEVSTDNPVKGWNQVAVPADVVVSTTGVTGYLLGYEFEQTASNYPIAMVNAGEPAMTYLYAKLSGSTARWQDVGLSSVGNLCVQAIVESENFPDYGVSVDKVSVPTHAVKSEGLSYSFTMSNFGVKTLDDYDLEVLIDDEPVVTLHAPAPLTQVPMTFHGSLPIADYESGAHTFTVHCVAINGEETYIEPDEDGEFLALTAIYPRRRHLIEHFTSQYCTWCPLGENVLKKVDALRGDVAWVSIHGDMSGGTDVFTIAKGNQVSSYLGCQSFPSAVFNRFDALGDGELCQGIGYYENVADQAAAYISETWMDNFTTPALASVAIDAHFDEATRQLDVKVSGQSSEDFEAVFGTGAALTVYLTEDGLHGRQLNQGVWYDDVVHNHVLRDVLSNAKGDAIGWNDDFSYENNYTTTLNGEWNVENMRVIAFISLTGRDKSVVNAEMRNLLPDPLPRGDIDGNRIIDVNDLSLLIDVVLGNISAADVPGDCHVSGGESIDVSDVSALIDIVLGNTGR